MLEKRLLQLLSRLGLHNLQSVEVLSRYYAQLVVVPGEGRAHVPGVDTGQPASRRCHRTAASVLRSFGTRH